MHLVHAHPGTNGRADVVFENDKGATIRTTLSLYDLGCDVAAIPRSWLNGRDEFVSDLNTWQLYDMRRRNTQIVITGSPETCRVTQLAAWYTSAARRLDDADLYTWVQDNGLGT